METRLIDRLSTSLDGKEAECVIEIGAHLVSDRNGYTHHGIYAGEGRVIHYGGFHHSIFRRPVEYIALRSFSAGRGVTVQAEPDAVYSGWEAVERAKSRLGEDRYRLLTNNCEHFCSWCRRGTGRSEQVRRCLRNPWEGVKTLLAVSRGRRAFYGPRNGRGQNALGWLQLMTANRSRPALART